MVRALALGAVLRVLAADCACDPALLDAAGVAVVEWRERPGRRRYEPRGPALHVLTAGRGVVASCSGSRTAWLRACLRGLTREAVFAAATVAALQAAVAADGQRLVGPHVAWTCPAEDFRPVPPPPGLERLDGGAVAGLYGQAGFPNALGYGRTPARPDVVAAAARDGGGAVVGVAAASADAEDLWQVGVEVLPGHRGRGLGRALVSAATEAVLARGRLPFYVTAPSNLASLRLAAGLGYRPAWTEAYARGE